MSRVASQCVRIAACLAFLAVWGVSSADEPVAKPKVAPAAVKRPAPTADQISGWINDLDAAEFYTRETAMLQMLEAGPGVLSALRPVLTGGSLEATSRALFVVRQLGLGSDLDTQDQAGQLLEELARRNEAPALARRAAAALVELTWQRSGQALNELERLGVKVIRTQVVGGFIQDDPVLSIEVGDGFHGEDADLRRLKWIIEAPIVILSGARATDAWVKEAAAMPGLDALHIYQAKISDAGLRPLVERQTIRQIGLYNTVVHDEVLATLAELPLLGFLKLYGTQVTKEGVEKFRLTSGVAVDFRRGAFLGVGGKDGEGGCLIGTVHKGSPADKAGILEDDVIIRFGGAEVKNFSSLTDLIAPRQHGEEVEIEIVRNDPTNGTRQVVTVKATLAAWEMETAIQNPRR